MKKKKIKKILIANRGEIARRIMRTCRELEISSVAIYTRGEEKFPHVLEADEAYLLEGADLKSTYLNKEKIVEIAQACSADAIHPGYGMLSERSEFAALVEKNHLIFIGPRSESIEKMGDKIGSKILAESLGVPLIPGYHGEDQSEKKLFSEMKRIGFPLLIKASAGGGGKGMKIVHKEEEFHESLNSAKSEALKAFGSDRVLLERYIERPRHIEAQVLCSDLHQQYFHLFERECSIQRRYQKIVEEAPASNIQQSTRDKLLAASLKLVEFIKYRGVGTLEFMVEEVNGVESFYFLEMNTRLQVEHPVTEMITGLDLVALQIRIAEGEAIPFKQEDLKIHGHAIEVRLYAEDPDNNFLPCVGEIKSIGSSTSPYVRADHGVNIGNVVSTMFDPMLSKVASWGRTRVEAIRRLSLALEEIHLKGIKTNLDYLRRILNHPQFIKGETYTHFVKIYADELKAVVLSDEEIASVIGHYLLQERSNDLECFQNV